MINYGPDLDNNNTIFNYVKVYKNRVEMEKDKNNNNVLVGSYVLIDYDRDADNDADSDYEDFNTNFEIDQDKYDTDPAFSIVGYDSTVWQKRYKNNTYIYEMVADLNLAASLGKQELNQQAILTSNQNGWISTAIPSEAGDNWIEVTVDTEGQLKIQHDKLNNEENDNITTSQETVKIPIIKYDSKGHVISINEGTVELATVEELEEEQNRAQQAEETILASTGDDWIQVSKNENKLNIKHIKTDNPTTTTVKDGINIPVISYDENGHIIDVENQQIKTENNWIYVGEDNKLRHKQQTDIDGTYGNNTTIPQITVDSAGHITTITEQNLPVSTSLNDENLSNLATIGQVQKVQEDIPQTTDELKQGSNNLYVSQKEKDAWNKKTSLEGYATEEYVDQVIADIKLPTQDELLPETFEELEAYYADEEGNSLNIITEDELVQSNYEENNETELSYIQNRPFYEEILFKTEPISDIPTVLPLGATTGTMSYTPVEIVNTLSEEEWEYLYYMTLNQFNFIQNNLETVWILNPDKTNKNNNKIIPKQLKDFNISIEENYYYNSELQGLRITFQPGYSLIFNFEINKIYSQYGYQFHPTWQGNEINYQTIYGFVLKCPKKQLSFKFLDIAKDLSLNSSQLITSNTIAKSIQGDYAENNEEQWNYIKNRPFYSLPYNPVIEYNYTLVEQIKNYNNNPIDEIIHAIITETGEKINLIEHPWGGKLSIVKIADFKSDYIDLYTEDSDLINEIYLEYTTPFFDTDNNIKAITLTEAYYSILMDDPQGIAIISSSNLNIDNYGFAGITFPETGVYATFYFKNDVLDEVWKIPSKLTFGNFKYLDAKYLPGSLLTEPSALPDNTIPIVSNGVWTTTTLKLAEEAEF